MSTLRRSLAGIALLLLTAGAAQAQVRIEEAMAGAFGRPEIQLVELRADFCDPAWPASARLTFHDAADQPAGEWVFPAPPAGACAGPVAVLVGTQAFADLASAPDPDFLMPPLLVAGSGKVCFAAPAEGILNCLTYGGFAGASGQSSPINAPALPVQDTCSLQHNNPIAPLHQVFNADFDLLAPAPANGAGETGTVVVPPRFQDVPAASPFSPFVEALFNAGVTGGCGAGAFCPAATVSRDQMAVFLLLAQEGPGFQPPPCATPAFADVPCAHPFAPWINELAARGLTGGCGGGNYCPSSPVHRDEMAVFLLLAREGADFQPPACAVPAFADVPCASPFAPWVNELAARGITGGCGPGAFCPEDLVRREQMAVFLSTTFGLPVPSRGCPAPPAADDHGDTLAAATPVGPAPAGIVIHGALERPRDVDMFSFTAQAGDLFTFRYDVGGRFPGSIGLLDAAGTILAGRSVPGFLSFTAPHSGTFFFLMRDAENRAVDTYQLFFRGPVEDDHGTALEQAVLLTPDGPAVAGDIEHPQDADIFALDTVAGELYLVEVAGSPGLRSVLTALDGGGNVVSVINQPGPDEVMALRPPSGGRFFFRVSAASGSAGAYEIRARGPIVDDHADGPPGATPLTAGVPASGELVPFGDLDFFSFTAGAEETFLLELEPLSNAFFRVQVLDASGATIVAEEHPLFAPVLVDTSSGGTFFVRVRQFIGTDSSSYRLTLTGPLADDHGDSLATATAVGEGGPPTAGEIEVFNDSDVFSFEAPASGLFLFELSGVAGGSAVLHVLGENGQLLGSSFSGEWVAFQATASRRYFAHVLGTPGTTYGIQARGPVPDPGSRPSMATPLAPDAPPVPAAIELGFDVDLYSFAAAAGESFFIKSTGDPGVRLDVMDLDGLTPLAGASANFVDGITELWFRAPRTGTFYVRATSDVRQRYELSLRGPFTDDHGNTPATATPLIPGAPPKDGEIESEVDFDLFFFDATAGQVLVVATADLGGGLDTLLDVLDADGLSQLATDDDSGGGLASRIRFVVPSTGRYLVRVRPFGVTIGTYRVSAVEE